MRAATAPGLAAARQAALERGLGWRLVKVSGVVVRGSREEETLATLTCASNVEI